MQDTQNFAESNEYKYQKHLLKSSTSLIHLTSTNQSSLALVKRILENSVFLFKKKLAMICLANRVNHLREINY